MRIDCFLTVLKTLKKKAFWFLRNSGTVVTF